MTITLHNIVLWIHQVSRAAGGHGLDNQKPMEKLDMVANICNSTQ